MSASEYQLLLKNLMDEQRHRFDRLEDKLDQKVGVERVNKLEQEIDLLRGATLTKDSVETQIGQALQSANARGWTAKERAMYTIGFVFLCVNFLIGLLALGPDLFGGK